MQRWEMRGKNPPMNAYDFLPAGFFAADFCSSVARCCAHNQRLAEQGQQEQVKGTNHRASPITNKTLNPEQLTCEIVETAAEKNPAAE